MVFGWCRRVWGGCYAFTIKLFSFKLWLYSISSLKSSRLSCWHWFRVYFWDFTKLKAIFRTVPYFVCLLRIDAPSISFSFLFSFSCYRFEYISLVNSFASICRKRKLPQNLSQWQQLCSTIRLCSNQIVPQWIFFPIFSWFSSSSLLYGRFKIENGIQGCLLACLPACRYGKLLKQLKQNFGIHFPWTIWWAWKIGKQGGKRPKNEANILKKMSWK